MERDGTRLIEMRLENFKGVELAWIRPNQDGVTYITGDNGQGKSTVLDAVAFLLQGSKAKIEEPIRNGSDKAQVLGITDTGLIITRELRDPGGWEVKVREDVGNGKTRTLRSPQAILNRLLDGNTLDVMDFPNDPTVEKLVRALGLAEFYEENRAARQASFDTRTDVNREVRRLEALIAGAPEPEEGLPEEEESAAELSAKISAAHETNNSIDNAQADVTRHTTALRQALAKEKELREQLETCLDDIAKAKEARKKALAKADELGEKIDVSELNQRMETLEATNAKVRAATDQRKNQAALEEQRARAEELTAEIAAADEQLDVRIDGSDFPIDGMRIVDGVPTYNGVSVKACSTAEKARIGCYVEAALRPELRMLRIERGESLGPAAMQEIAAFCEEQGYQALVERVDTSGDIGIFLREGSVVAVDGEPVDQAATER